MPKIDRKLISKKADIVADLKKIIKAENIIIMKMKKGLSKLMH